MDTNLGLMMLIAGLIAFIIGVILMNTASTERNTYKAAKDALDEERESLLARGKSSVSKSKDDGPSAVELELTETVTKLREDLKKAKKKSHEQSKELEDLRARDKAARDAKPSAEESASTASAGELHLQLSKVQNENLELQQKIKELEKEARSGKKTSKKAEATEEAAEEPKPKKKPKKEAVEAPAGESADELRAHYEERLAELRSEKDDLESDLRRKLNNSLIATDRERRRADNNDKAYLVTQRELDAARERLGLIEERIRKAAFAAESTQEAEAAPEVAPHGDPVMDDAKAVAEKSSVLALAAPSDEEDEVAATSHAEAEAEVEDIAIPEEPTGLAEASAADEQWAELGEDIDLDDEDEES